MSKSKKKSVILVQSVSKTQVGQFYSHFTPGLLTFFFGLYSYSTSGFHPLYFDLMLTLLRVHSNLTLGFTYTLLYVY